MSESQNAEFRWHIARSRSAQRIRGALSFWWISLSQWEAHLITVRKPVELLSLSTESLTNSFWLAKKILELEPESTDGYRAFADAWRAVIDLPPEEKTAHRGFADACLAIGDSQTSDNALQGRTQT